MTKLYFRIKYLIGGNFNEKNKVITLAVAAVAGLTLVAGATYAWFTSEKISEKVDVTTGEVALDGGAIANPVGPLYAPGDFFDLMDDDVKFKNTGSLDAIVQLSLYDAVEAKLAPGATTHADWTKVTTTASDYKDVGADKFMTPKRITETIKLDMTDAATNDWKYEPTQKKYYTLIEVNQEASLGNVKLTILGELGGNFNAGGGAGNTVSRQFEQGTVFQVAYKGMAVQNTKDAVRDVFGSEAVGIMPDSLGWYRDQDRN